MNKVDSKNIDDLKEQIIDKFGTISAFSKAMGWSKQNTWAILWGMHQFPPRHWEKGAELLGLNDQTFIAMVLNIHLNRVGKYGYTVKVTKDRK